MMTVCPDGCGACCERIYLPMPLEEALELDFSHYAEKHGEDEPAKLRFFMEHLVKNEGEDNSLRCTLLDPVTKKCTQYENRPHTCSKYPWYGQGPSQERAEHLPEVCVFIGEVA